MDNLEKEFNKRFQYKQLSNDDFDTDNLWSSIEEELDNKKKRPVIMPIFLLGFLIMALFLLGLKVVSKTSDHTKLSRVKTIETQEKNHFIAPAEFQMNPNEETTGITKEPQSLTNRAEPHTSKIPLTFSEGENSRDLSASENTIATAAPDYSSKTERLSVLSTLVLDSDIKHGPDKLLSKSADGSGKLANVEEVAALRSAKERLIVKNRAILPLLQNNGFRTLAHIPKAPLPNGFLLPTPTPGAEKLDDETERKQNLRFALTLFGGVNRSQFSFVNSTDQAVENLKNEAESGDFGQSISIGMALTTQKGLVFGSGLEYYNTWTIFNYAYTSSGQVVRGNQLLKVWKRGTEVLREEFGDATVNTDTSRMIKHHNQFTQLAFPFTVGYQKQANNFLYGINAGAAINFLLDQTGKSLGQSEREIVEFARTDNHAPLNSLNIGLSLNAFIGYQFSDHTSILISPNWAWQAHDRNQQKLNLQRFGLNLGLRYDFDERGLK